MLTRHPLVMAALALALAACAGDDAAQPDAHLPDPGRPDAGDPPPASDAGDPDAARLDTTDARVATPALILGSRELALVEGATATVTVRLDAAPAAPITVAVASSAPAAFVATPATLIFDATTWSAPQTVTITALEDDDAAGASGAVAVTAPGLVAAAIAVDVADNDGAPAISAPANLLVGEGDATLFIVTLTRAPARTVEVTVTSRAPALLAATPATLRFSPTTWHLPQRVDVTAATDADLADDRIALDLTSPDLEAVVVTAVVVDATQPRIALSTDAVELAEGRSARVAVSLRDRPARDTVVTLTSSDPAAAAVSPTRLTFTPARFDQPQSVQIATTIDADADDERAAIAVATGDRVQATIAVSVRDAVARAILASPSPFAVVEGERRELAITLSAPPPAGLLVRARSEDTAAVVVAPDAFAFNAGNWSVPQMLTVIGVRDADVADDAAAVVLEADGHQGARVEVTVEDPDVQELLATAGPLRVVEGTTIPVAVLLRRPPGRPVVVTAALAGTGVATIAPAELTFTDANWSVVQHLTLAGLRDGNVVNDRTELLLRTEGAVDVVREVEVVDTRVP